MHKGFNTFKVFQENIIWTEDKRDYFSSATHSVLHEICIYWYILNSQHHLKMSRSSPVKCGFCLLSYSFLTELLLFVAQVLNIQNHGCKINGGTWLLWWVYCLALHLRSNLLWLYWGLSVLGKSGRTWAPVSWLNMEQGRTAAKRTRTAPLPQAQASIRSLYVPRGEITHRGAILFLNAHLDGMLLVGNWSVWSVLLLDQMSLLVLAGGRD